MYVCVCLAVTDREVEAAIEKGACSRESVTSACGAGGDCGACHEMIEKMIEDSTGKTVDAARDQESGVIDTSRLLRRGRAA